MKKLVKRYYAQYTGLNQTTWYMISLKFFNSILISLNYFLPIYFVNKLHISISMSGIIISTYGLGTVIGSFIGGKLSDDFSPLIICIMSLLIQSVTFSSLPFLHTSFLLIINLFIAGIATYSLITATYVMTLSNCQKNQSQRLKAINILDTTSNLGLGLSALIISTLGIDNIQFLYISAGLSFMLLALFLGFNFFKLNATLSMTEQTTTSVSKENTSNLKSNRSILSYIYVSLFFAGMIISQLSSTYSIYLSRLFPNYNFGGFGIIFTLNTLLVVILQTPLANYCSKYNHILVAGLGVFLLGFGMSLLTIAVSFAFILFTCILYTFGEMLFFSVSQSICYEYAPKNKKGATLGMPQAELLAP